MTAKLATLLMSLFLVSQAEFYELNGVVLHVQDGDTFSLKSGNSVVKVRLAHVFAPKMNQPFGKVSRKYLEELILRRKVRVDVLMIDADEHFVGEVQLTDERWVNDEVLAAGMAWHYRVSDESQDRYARLEYHAFKNKLGLWVQKDPLPPWEYSREKTLPSPPAYPGLVVYDKIFNYGIVGDKQAKVYRLPSCKGYSDFKPGRHMVFSNLLDADASGMRLSKDCQIPF